MRKTLIAVALMAITLGANAQTKSNVDKANMDLSVKPGENFYQYAVGNWLKNHPLDAQHPMNGAFIDLEEQNNDRIKELVKEYADKKMPQALPDRRSVVCIVCTWTASVATRWDTLLSNLY